MNKSLLTIAIPTYNRCKSLSILLTMINDSYSNLEFEFQNLIDVIVCDNFSTDDTLDTVNRFIKKKCFPLKLYSENKNMGFSFNWKKCFDKATGDYVLVLGDDDLISNDFLEIILNFIINNNDIKLIGLNSFGFNNNFDTERPKSLLKNTTSETSDPGKFLKLIGPNLLFISSLIFNKSLLDKKIIKTIFNSNDSDVIQLYVIIEYFNISKYKYYFLHNYLIGALRTNPYSKNKGICFAEVLINEPLVLMNKYINSHYKTSIIKNYLKVMAYDFIPYQLIRYRKYRVTFNSNYKQIIYKYYKNTFFYIVIYPLIYFPKHFAIPYGWLCFFIFKIYSGKLNRIFFEILNRLRLNIF